MIPISIAILSLREDRDRDSHHWQKPKFIFWLCSWNFKAITIVMTNHDRDWPASAQKLHLSTFQLEPKAKFITTAYTTANYHKISYFGYKETFPNIYFNHLTFVGQESTHLTLKSYFDFKFKFKSKFNQYRDVMNM